MGNINTETTNLGVASAGSTILSPNQLRSQFASYYEAEMDELAIKQFARQNKQKAAVVNTLKRLGYVIENKEVITEKIADVITASSVHTKAKVESLMNDVERQHTQVYSREVAAVIAEASREIGFANVQIEYNNASPEILAQDAKGRALRSEIHIDHKSKVLSLVSETIGISDGSCRDVMEAFSKALAEHGVKSSATDRKWTGGQCWLPRSRDAEQRLKRQRKAEEVGRARKLNTRTNIKNG
jgi:hypothetical protein